MTGRRRHRLDGVEGDAYLPCPGDCGGDVRVRFRADGGEPAVWYPNDRAHPGAPPHCEVVDVEPALCDCDPFDPEAVADALERDCQPELLDAAADSW